MTLKARVYLLGWNIWLEFRFGNRSGVSGVWIEFLKRRMYALVDLLWTENDTNTTLLMIILMIFLCILCFIFPFQNWRVQVTISTIYELFSHSSSFKPSSERFKNWKVIEAYKIFDLFLFKVYTLPLGEQLKSNRLNHRIVNAMEDLKNWKPEIFLLNIRQIFQNRSFEKFI